MIIIIVSSDYNDLPHSCIFIYYYYYYYYILTEFMQKKKILTHGTHIFLRNGN